MPTPAELEKKFWKTLKSDMTVMLGLVDAEEGPYPPDDRDGRARARARSGSSPPATPRSSMPSADGHRAIATFSAKNHSLFAAIHGDLRVDNDRAVDRPAVEPVRRGLVRGRQGRPEAGPAPLRCRTMPRSGKTASSLIAGIKMLFGRDPKRDYQDKVAARRPRRRPAGLTAATAPATMPLSWSRPISWSGKPQDAARISSVCWPSAGAGSGGRRVRVADVERRRRRPVGCCRRHARRSRRGPAPSDAGVAVASVRNDWYGAVGHAGAREDRRRPRRACARRTTAPAPRRSRRGRRSGRPRSRGRSRCGPPPPPWPGRAGHRLERRPLLRRQRHDHHPLAVARREVAAEGAVEVVARLAAVVEAEFALREAAERRR